MEVDGFALKFIVGDIALPVLARPEASLDGPLGYTPCGERRAHVVQALSMDWASEAVAPASRSAALLQWVRECNSRGERVWAGRSRSTLLLRTEMGSGRSVWLRTWWR